MDYEDNDFQNHTFQLAVDESVKFSPGSHSYSLPKFDLDDSLQVHLRFDSLVESEVLLGIQSHEENQWIEDFSRENSALEFSSGPAESCSISRCNNVWSEATSSESVDLLLKSVGQDEMVMEEPIIEESYNCDGLDSLTNQMQPNLNQDGLSPPKSENATCVAPPKLENATCAAGPLTAIDGPTEQLSTLDKDVVNQFPKINSTTPNDENATSAGSLTTIDEPTEQLSTLDKDVVDQFPQINSTFLNGVSEGFIDGNSGVLNSSEDENCKGPSFGEENNNSTVVREDVSLVANSGGIKLFNDPGTPRCTQVNPSTAGVQNFIDAAVDHLPEIDSSSPNGVSEGIIDGDSGVLNSIEDQNGKGYMFGEGNYKSTEVIEDVSLVEDTGGIKSANDPGTPECTQVDPSTACAPNFVDSVADQLPEIGTTSPNGVGEGFIDGSSGIVKFTEDDNGKGSVFGEENYNSTVEREDASLVDNTEGVKSVNDSGTPESAQVNPSSACVKLFTDVGVLNNDDTQKDEALDKDKDEVGGHPVSSGMLSCQTHKNHLVDADGSYAGKASSLVQKVDIISQITKLNNDGVVTQPSAQVSGCEHGYSSGFVHKIDSVSQITELSSDAMATQYTAQINDKDVVDQLSQIDPTPPVGVSGRSIDGSSGVVRSDAIDTPHGQLSEYEHGYSSKDADMVDLTRENPQKAPFLMVESKSTCEARPAEANTGNAGLTSVQILHASDQQGFSDVESVAKHSLEDLSKTVVHLLDNVISASNTDGSTVKEKMISQIQGNTNSGDNIDHSSRLTTETCSSPGIIDESQRCEDMEDGYHGGETQIAEACSTSLLDESQQRHDQSFVEKNSSIAHLCHPDAPTLEKETGEFLCSSPIAKELPETATDSPDVTNKSSDISDDVDHLHSHIKKDRVIVGRVDSDSPSYEGSSPTRVLEAGSSCLSSNEPTCGSPTIISCTEAPRSEKRHQERIMESLDHIEPDNLEQDCDKVKHVNTDIKENDASEGDRSFTFNVTSLEDSSQERTGSGWKPFPSLQPYDVPQGVACYGALPSGFRGTDSKMSGHGISGESNTSATPECSSENRKMLVAVNSAERETAAEGEKSQDGKFLHGVEECQNGIRRLDPNIAVSGILEQTKNVGSSIVPDSNEKIAAEVDRRVAVEVNSIDPPEKETCYKWKPVHNAQAHETPQPVGVSPPAISFIREIDAKTLQEITRESSPRTSGAKTARRNYKSSSDKKMTSPGKVSEKENNKEGTIFNETISLKHTKLGGSNPLSTPVASPVSVTQVVKAGEKQAVGFTEGNSILSSVTTIQTSSLPDLNSSSTSYTSCPQPFTDLQQVQLRAQIFVYGSIIQGTAPDEACMLAAFGESGGGRSAWETVWHVAVERLHNQKSPLSITKTPVNSHAGARATEATRQTVYRTEGVCTPSGTDSSKFSSVVFNPNMAFSSPVWAVSTACREGSLSTSISKGPLLDSSKTSQQPQPFPSLPLRQYVGNTSPWLPQVPSPGNWAAFNAGVHPTLPTSETVRVTSIRESPASHRSGKQHTPVSPYLPTSGSSDNTPVMDAKRTNVSPAKHASAEPKHRKRGRTLAFEQSSQISSFGQPRNDPVSLIAQLPATVVTKNSSSGINVGFSSLISESPVVSSAHEPGQIFFPVQHLRHSVSGTTQSPTLVATTTLTSSMNTESGMIITGSAPISIKHGQPLGGGKTEVTVSPHEELYGRIEQAKREAQDAAVLAATAVGHCQSIWSQISLQNKSGTVLDIGAELESSAVAIAAAASVAKAAAAVTKVASEAAVQAKLMYDEAFATKYGIPLRETSLHDDLGSLGMVTSSSILKGKDQTSNTDSVFAAVREAARKRVEAASASAKRAENLDAVLKAAEMTAEAVSQAGTIIAMGEPLPFTLSQLIDAGPEGYWRAQQKSSEQLVKSNNLLTEKTVKDGREKSLGATVVETKDQLLNKKETGPILDMSKGSAENKHFLADGLQLGSLSNSGKGLEAQNGCKEHVLSKTTGVFPESEAVSASASIAIRDEYDGPQAVRNSNGNKFEEGSLVEVRSDEEGLRMVWYSAKVLNLKDGKALVSYAEHARREGSGLPTEWVPLDDGGNAPRIRIPHPMNMIKNEGTKKRSREARGDYTWSIGDKVDAWIRNGWWEGIVTEKGKEDETNLTVHFPAQQETSVVRAWNLRPSLIWEDGRWVEWSRLMESSILSHGAGTPQGKPPKKSRIESEVDPAVEAKGNIKVAKPPSVMEVGKPETLKLLNKLPSIMEVGKTELSKPLMLSAKDKVFNAGKSTTNMNLGVPKPGRKRKFMDVKQCASDRSNNVSKPTMFKPGKSHGSTNISTRDVAQESLSSKKKSSVDVSINVKSKAKVAPSGEKSIKVNERSTSHDHLSKSTPNAVEPRRSNRRIQPTSRLLEGLQSSLSVSKIPFSSHDRGTKSQQSSLRGRSHG